MRILVFAPHNDDEVLGVGGTIAKYSKQGGEVFVCEVTSSSNSELCNLIKAEAAQAHRILGVRETIFLDLPVVALKQVPAAELNKKILDVVEKIKPEIVFIPHRGDIHTDHHEVSRSTMVALRPHLNPQLKTIYAYETLSETEWDIPSSENAFIPNVWSDISDTIDIKLEAMKCYKSQLKEYPHPRSLDAIIALSKVRGSTICVHSAEAFMPIRSII